MSARRRTKDSLLYGMYGLVGELESETPTESPTPHKTRLPGFRLETKSERDALRNLRPKWGPRSAEFRRLVLVALALIAEQVRQGHPTRPHRYKRSELVRKLKRRASKVRDFAAKLQKPLLGLSFMPLPPTRELCLYADSLAARAESMAKPGTFSETYPPVGPPEITGQPQKRTSRAETGLILKLIEFVRTLTGEPHWNDLVALLKRPCNDVGMSKDRLRALWKFHAHKRARRPRHVFPRPRRLITPPETYPRK